MRLFPPSTILPTTGADEHCGHHNSTCILTQTPCTLRTHCTGRTPPDQQASSPTIVIHKPLSPTSFPIGCWVTVMPSHVKHANTNGTVTRHTAKFVEFVPDNCHSNTICILSKSLTITLPPAATSTPPAPCPNKAPNQRITLHAADDNQTRTPGQREQDNIAYDNLGAETAKITVADGFVSFTRTFRYLGSLINYSLRDNDDIMARIASATAAMVA
jgi:hypothetical protein